MAMLLTGENGTEFELGLIAETLDPDLEDDDNDDTALTLSFRVATPEEEWEETAPCLNTFEVNNLAEWLEAVAGERPELGELELLEPDLRFSIVGDHGKTVTVRIDFHLQDRPERLAMDAPTDADHVDIKIARGQVKAAAAELKRELEEMHLAGGEQAETSELDDVAAPDQDLNLVDEVEDEPEGMGDGEDNAGEH